MIKQLIILLTLIIPATTFSQNVDIRLLRYINSSENQSSDNFFKFISNSNDVVNIGTPLTMGVVGLIKHDKTLIRNAGVIVVGSVINGIATISMKTVINRSRPFETYPDIMKKSSGGSSSFPSGHTSSAFATATSLSLLYPKWYVIAPSFAWASTVGYSRMHLGVHYPSDVLAGALTGAGSAYLSYKLNNWLNNYQTKKHEHQ